MATSTSHVDLRDWVLADPVVAWSLDNIAPRHHKKVVEALVTLAGRSSDLRPVAEISPTLQLGIDRNRGAVFLSCNGRKSICHYTFYCFRTDSSQPSVLIASLPRLLHRSGLTHPRRLYDERRVGKAAPLITYRRT